MLKVTLGNHYLAFVLDAESRKWLLDHYPPSYEVVKCHHVTVCYEIEEEYLPYLQRMVDRNYPAVVTTTRYIRADQIDLFPVCFDYMPLRRDGKHYHLTHSHSEFRQASDANLVFSKKIPVRFEDMDGMHELTGEFQLIPYKEN